VPTKSNRSLEKSGPVIFVAINKKASSEKKMLFYWSVGKRFIFL
jgi:hypothetical protein